MKVIETISDLSDFNDRQREAILSDEKRLLVLAGAGSGKTKTLIQKIIYLIEEKKVKPSNIVAITFTKNAANEMLDRLIAYADSTGEYDSFIKDKKNKRADKDNKRQEFAKKIGWINNLTVRTFHSLCYTVLKNYGVNEFDNKFRILNDIRDTEDAFGGINAPESDYDVMHKVLISCCESKDYILNLKRYILDYFVDKIHIENHHKPAREYGGKFYTTLNGTKVRSKSERDIADWLYRHNIPFVYEPVINISDFDFHPDFFIPLANLYIEHVSDISYKTSDKELQFEKGNIHYVKTFESMSQDSTLFNLALERIIRGKLSSDYTPGTALSYEEEFKTYKREMKEFIYQVLRAVDMVKVENHAFDYLHDLARKDQHERVRLFYDIAEPLYNGYCKYCINKSYIDFNDMIIKALDIFKNQEDVARTLKERFKYILVDEFQDVNSLQVDLLKEMLTDDTSLFCVGDDWQSIYGFRGSEVEYIVNFQKHFPGAKVVKLDYNYRSNDQIVAASNEVIKNNRFKLDKEIRSVKKTSTKITVFDYNTVKEGAEFVAQEVKKLVKDGVTPDDILLLYRRTRMLQEYSDILNAERLYIMQKTIHASKGLEAKAVFIIGLYDGHGGFPDIWLNDRIFQVIKKTQMDLLLEEERRLFYVALTRAKDNLYLLAEKGNNSMFINEIPEAYKTSYKIAGEPVINRIFLCENCATKVEQHFIYCPQCGVGIHDDVKIDN